MEHGLLKISRLGGLTDGVFAIAMTLLVLPLQIPQSTLSVRLSVISTIPVLHNIFIYAGSFIILGTQWVGINFQQGFLERVNRPYFWVTIFYLMLAGIVPYSASLVVNYHDNPVSILFYVGNLLCSTMMQFVIWQCAHMYKLNGAVYTSEARIVVLQRIFIPALFYVLAIFLAFWDTTIAFIALFIPPLFHIKPGKVDRYSKK